MNLSTALDAVPVPGDSTASPDWMTARRFALALAVLLIALFPGVITGSQSFVFRDFSIFGYPVAFYHRECFWRGEIPLWNNLSNCGIPFLAQWNTMTLYPLSLIYLLLPLPWSLNLFSILHLFLGGMGMFFLASRWTHCSISGAVAGLTFAFSGIVTVALAWPNIIAVLGWMPWVILTVERGYREGGFHLWIAVLVGTLQMLAGMPEFIAFTWIVVAALFLLEKPSRFTFLRLGAIVVLIAATSAAQLLPFFELLLQSRRQAMFESGAWPMPLWGWASFLAPLIHTRPVPLGVYMSDAQPVITSYYVALSALVLSIVALIWVRTRKVYMLAALSFLALWLAIGRPGYLYEWLLELCPFLGAFRYPVKFVVALTFCVPVLAAFGLAFWRKNAPAGFNRHTHVLVGAAAALIALTVAALWCAQQQPLPGDDWPAAWKNAAWRVFFLLVSIGALLGLSSARRQTQLVATGVLFLALLVDSITHAPRYPTVSANAFAPGAIARLIDPPPPPASSRALMTRPTHDFLYFGMLNDPFNDLIGRRVCLFGNLNLIDNVASPDGFFSMYLPAQRDLWKRLFTAPADTFPGGLADFFGVSHMTSLTKPMQWTTRSNALGLVSAGQAPIFTNAHATINAMAGTSFDPRTTVYLPSAAESEIAVTRRSDATILKQEIQPQQMRLQVQCSEPSLVVVANSHYKRWRAFVDGQPVKIWRANFAFQALQVPAGRHEVELRYIDSLFHLGCAISLAALGLSLVALAYTWKRARQTSTSR